MLIRTSPRPQIEKLLADVGRLKTDVQSLERDYRDCYSTSQDAGRNLQNADWPLRRAQQDTAKVDSSSDGRQAQMYLDSAERNLDTNERELRQVDWDSDAACSKFDQAQRDLDQAITDSSAYPATLASLQQAKSDLAAADREHDNADNRGSWAANNTQSANSELRWADSDVRQITYDRPGQDVSHYARSAGSRVDRAEWDVRDADTDLNQCRNAESRAEQGLGSVEDQLRRALAQLPPDAQ